MLTLRVGNRRCVDQGIRRSLPHCPCSSSRWRNHGATQNGSAARRPIISCRLIERTLELDPVIHKLAERFAEQHHALFLGRGALYPIAMEAPLKLRKFPTSTRSVSARTEHGPLALRRCRHAVITVAPTTTSWRSSSRISWKSGPAAATHLFGRPRKSAFTIRRRNGDREAKHVTYFQAPARLHDSPAATRLHVAILKGPTSTNRANLAKSVTVE